MEEVSKHKKNAANALMTANGTLHIPIQRKGVITVRAEGGAGGVLFILLEKIGMETSKISSVVENPKKQISPRPASAQP